MPATGSFKKPKTPLIGCAVTPYSTDERTRMLLQLWRQRHSSPSISAAMREMVEHAWETREVRREGAR